MEGKLFTSFFQEEFISFCSLADCFCMGNFDVDTEADGMASVLENCCKKARSLGCIGKFTLE